MVLRGRWTHGILTPREALSQNITHTPLTHITICFDHRSVFNCVVVSTSPDCGVALGVVFLCALVVK